MKNTIPMLALPLLLLAATPVVAEDARLLWVSVDGAAEVAVSGGTNPSVGDYQSSGTGHSVNAFRVSVPDTNASGGTNYLAFAYEDGGSMVVGDAESVVGSLDFENGGAVWAPLDLAAYADPDLVVTMELGYVDPGSPSSFETLAFATEHLGALLDAPHVSIQSDLNPPAVTPWTPSVFLAEDADLFWMVEADGAAPQFFATLQAAIDAAPDGGTIRAVDDVGEEGVPQAAELLADKALVLRLDGHVANVLLTVADGELSLVGPGTLAGYCGDDAGDDPLATVAVLGGSFTLPEGSTAKIAGELAVSVDDGATALLAGGLVDGKVVSESATDVVPGTSGTRFSTTRVGGLEAGYMLVRDPSVAEPGRWYRVVKAWTITWMSGGEVIQRNVVATGTTAADVEAMAPANPTPADGRIWRFDGWEPAFVAAENDIVYVAQFTLIEGLLVDGIRFTSILRRGTHVVATFEAEQMAIGDGLTDTADSYRALFRETLGSTAVAKAATVTVDVDSKTGAVEIVADRDSGFLVGLTTAPAE